MKVHWRYTHGTRNTYAALYAACESEGISLPPVSAPTRDITCYSLNALNAETLLAEIEQAECITIAGGPYATACFREVAKKADYVIVGEGECRLPTLLSAIGDGTADLLTGVATSSGYRPADTVVRLDAWPPFSRMKGYVEISRGCPFSCAYCQTPRIFGHGMRHRSIDQIVCFASRYRDARFVTPNALAYGSDGRAPRFDKIQALLKRLRNNIYFGTFPSEVRPEFVSEEALSLITSYCANTNLQFGAQSGSDAVLERLKRGHRVEDVIRAVELCLDSGLLPVVDIIVGFPFETEVDQRATIELIRWISSRGKIHAHLFMPLPGTPLEATCPSPLLPELSRLLGSLALKGKVTGSWRDPRIAFCGSCSNDRA
ncbi:MAG: TIGR04013 family B12-binding domain/radical SAM domain-containing protein [Methanoregulaceae archaeon]|jgi:B12-binding domain/radical SAM domain protein|nr:TIGR04013 family B12-binding domain/radical SAM domain-containing protein [Methanoregulaceae archaeon]